MIERVSAALDVASAILAEAVAGGVTDVVLCPGSRSAPFAYAALAAQLGGTLRLHVRVDERSAGFLALGLAKVSRRPALVITTSGTAVANLHPAVLEAHHGHVPLIVISADRPAHLRGTGANQTTLQPGMFGTALRHEIDLMAEEATDVAGERDRRADAALLLREIRGGDQVLRPGPGLVRARAAEHWCAPIDSGHRKDPGRPG